MVAWPRGGCALGRPRLHLGHVRRRRKRQLRAAVARHFGSRLGHRAGHHDGHSKTTVGITISLEETDMRKISGLLLVLMIVSALPLSAQTDSPVARPQDVSSADAIVAAVYDVISGPAGQKRDW